MAGGTIGYFCKSCSTLCKESQAADVFKVAETLLNAEFGHIK